MNTQDQTQPNQAPQNAEQTQTNQNGQPLLSNPEVVRLIEQVRNEEKQKLYSTINKTKESQKTLENELRQIKAEHEATMKKLKEQETSQLPADEKLKKQLAEMEAQFASTQKQLLDQVTMLNHQSQMQKIEAYKERRLREEMVNGPLFVEQVVGNSEEEIEQAIQQSRINYTTLRNQFLTEFLQQQEAAKRLQEFQQQQQATASNQQPLPTGNFQGVNPYYVRNGFPPGAMTQRMPVPQVSPQTISYQFNPAGMPQPNPGYYQQSFQQVPTQQVAQPQQATGFPSTPAVSSPVSNQMQNQMKNLTSEEAIRSGEYAKQRQNILNSIRQTQ